MEEEEEEEEGWEEDAGWVVVATDAKLLREVPRMDAPAAAVEGERARVALKASLKADCCWVPRQVA